MESVNYLIYIQSNQRYFILFCFVFQILIFVFLSISFRIFIMNTLYFLFLSQFFCLAVCPFNYISNGGFQQPIVDPPNLFEEVCPTNWTCFATQLIGSLHVIPNILFSQFMDTQGAANGFIQQQISLPLSGQCTLSYYQATFSDGKDYKMQIWWNQVLIITKVPTTLVSNLQIFHVQGIKGRNKLKFAQIGLIDYAGTLLDNISLTCSFDQNKSLPVSSEILSLMAIGISIPVSNIYALRNFYLTLADVWLYNYDFHKYEGIIDNIFFTIALIQQLKFSVLQKWFGWSKYKEQLCFSDYSAFTDIKFLQNEHSSSLFIDSNFQFFVYTIPKHILVYSVMYILFMITKSYKISIYFRPYYFIKTLFLQSVLQQNIAYFTYVCFSNLLHFFAFKLLDKLWLIFTLAFFFAIMIFGLNFYYLMGRYLNHQAYHFHYCLYRSSSSYHFLTIKNLARGLIRGSIFAFLRYFYLVQVSLLGAFELFLVVYIITIEGLQGIFITKTLFCRNLTYHFMDFALNVVFLAKGLFADSQSEHSSETIGYLRKMQEIILYILIVTVLLGILFDSLPLKWFRLGYYSEESQTNSSNIQVQFESNGSTLNTNNKQKQSANPSKDMNIKANNRKDNRSDNRSKKDNKDRSVSNSESKCRKVDSGRTENRNKNTIYGKDRINILKRNIEENKINKHKTQVITKSFQKVKLKQGTK